MNRRQFLAGIVGATVVGPVAVKAATEAGTWGVRGFDGMTGPYWGRTLAWKGTRFYWSEKGRMGTFDFAADGNWMEPNGQSVTLITIEDIARSAKIYTGDGRTYRLTGDPGNDDWCWCEEIWRGRQ